jgi:hypothetical protein
MIHVIFNPSAAGILRRALSSQGKPEKVIDLSDALDWGPISSTLAERASWLDNNAPSCIGSWSWLVEGDAWFRKAIALDQERLIWISPRDAREQAGFYWYLDQFGADGAQLVILEDASTNSDAPLSLGELGEAQMTELLESWPRAACDLARFPLERWQTLRAENALLRVVKQGRLESAPQSFFDEYLIEHCSQGWTNWSRVVGEAMMSMWAAGHRAGLYLLEWRLRDLVVRGQLECLGELPPVDHTWESMVRVA